MANEQESDIIKDQTQSQDSQPLDSHTPAEEPISSNKRIAKNAIMLYFRMFLSMIVGLYTSRIVLNTLGVEDYGIYGIVGGVVSMLGFLNASMAGATSRFITFEIGKGNLQRLKDTFSSALIIHIGIAIVIFILAETVGLWFLNNKLVIPENRLVAANWVYQMSILSTMLSITQVPYNACIIAHEKMAIYAYIEILNVTLRLVIVYLLVIGNLDKLILYSILTLVVSIIIMMIYRIYCIHKFQECHFHWIWNREILRPLLSFSGWDLYGNMCVTAHGNGTNFIINIFHGVICNAASSIATTVTGAVSGLTGNIMQAFRPQIIKNYAAGDFSNMQRLADNAILYSILFMGAIMTPFLIETNYIIKLWLGVVPAYSVQFCQIILFTSLLGFIIRIINIMFHATGKIKTLSIIIGSLYLLNIPIMYIVLLFFNSPILIYFCHIFLCAIIIIIELILLKRIINAFLIMKCLKKLILGISNIIIIIFICYTLTYYIQESVFRLIICVLISIITTSLITYIFYLPKSIKEYISKKIKQTVQRNA